MLILPLGLMVLAMGCSSATPTDTPGVDQLGRYILKQEGPEVDVVLGYKFAKSKVGAEWLILEMAISSPAGTSAKVERDNVWVKAPDGVKIPLATQESFGQAYSKMRNVIAAADIARDPLEYFPPSRRPCLVQFFVPPGAGVAYDSVSVNDRRACQGRLFFKVPGGVDSGRWTFGIDLEESTVRIPFEL
jgi:hypothetical protein